MVFSFWTQRSADPVAVLHLASQALEINTLMQADSSEIQHSVFKEVFTMRAIMGRWMVWICIAREWLEMAIFFV